MNDCTDHGPVEACAHCYACAECGHLISEHIGGTPCLPAVTSNPRSLHDLPIFGWAWTGDAKVVER